MNLTQQVKKAIKGNHTAFEKLIQSHQLMMYRVSRTILSQDEDCADAMQEAIMKAFQSIHTLKEPRYFKTWLMRILMNECYQLHRKGKDIVSMGKLPEPLVKEKGFQIIEIKQLLDLLSSEDKQLLKLFHIEDLTIRDLAQMLDIPENTVKTRLRRARLKIRGKLMRSEGINNE